MTQLALVYFNPQDTKSVAGHPPDDNFWSNPLVHSTTLWLQNALYPCTKFF